jgi:hypothetical protein
VDYSIYVERSAMDENAQGIAIRKGGKMVAALKCAAAPDPDRFLI